MWIVILLVLIPIILCRPRIQPAVTLLAILAWGFVTLKTFGPRPHGAALALGGWLLLLMVSAIKVRVWRAITDRDAPK